MLINRHPALLVLARKIWYLNGGILAEEKKKRKKERARRKRDEKNEHEHEGRRKKRKKRKSRGGYEMKRSIAT